MVIDMNNIDIMSDKFMDYSNMAYALAQKLREHYKVDEVYDMLAKDENYDFIESDMVGVVLTDSEWALYDTLKCNKNETFRLIKEGTWDCWYVEDIKVLGEEIWDTEIRKTDDELKFKKYIDFEKVVEDKIASGELILNEGYGRIFKIWEKDGE